jgi:hypothetical protein
MGFLFLVVGILFAQEKPVELIGHNLTPSVYTLHKNQFTLGNYTLAYGLSENILVATSPWLYTNYNMQSWVIKSRGTIGDNYWGLQIGYFKTLRVPPNVFDMEAYGVWAVHQLKIQDNYSFTYGFNILQFINDNVPFSLRRASFDSNKTQISLVTLHEFNVNKHYGFLAEIGIIGPDYVYPNLHWGFSLHYRNSWFLGQLGLSSSGLLSRLGQQNVSINYTAGHGQTIQQEYDEYYKSTVVPHPEIQIQFYY